MGGGPITGPSMRDSPPAPILINPSATIFLGGRAVVNSFQRARLRAAIESRPGAGEISTAYRISPQGPIEGSSQPSPTDRYPSSRAVFSNPPRTCVFTRVGRRTAAGVVGEGLLHALNL